MKYFARLKDYITRFIKKGLSPTEIASAVALGNFIGFIPIMGTHTIMAIGLSHILKLNTFVVFLGTQISNPISYPLQLFISAEIGNLILHGRFLEIEFSTEINYLSHYILPIIVGGLVLGIVVSGLSYFLIKYFLNKRKHPV